jgi:hypothetical protein
MITREVTNPVSLRRWSWPALVIGIVAVALGVLLSREAIDELLKTYLVAWLFLWGLGLGGLALVMIHHLTGGVWGLAMRRIFEAQMLTLPVIGLLFTPIALRASQFYPWPVQTATGDELHHFRDRYFESQFVFGRAIAYFVLWIGVAWLLRFWTRQEDSGRAARAAWRCNSLSGPGLVIYAVTLHFATVDWMMSLELPFTSTIYAPIVAASQLLTAFSCAVLVLCCVWGRQEFARLRCKNVLSDIGNLLLTLVLVWAYLIWCQAMLIWMADLRSDNSWWIVRGVGGWQWISIAGAILGLAVPLLGLLLRAVKQNTWSLARIAGLVLLIQVLFVGYQVCPSLALSLKSALWLLPLVFVGLTAIWFASFLWCLASVPLAPFVDRSWPHARHLQHLEQVEIAGEESLESDDQAPRAIDVGTRSTAPLVEIRHENGHIEHPAVKHESADVRFGAIAATLIVMALSLAAVGAGARSLLRSKSLHKTERAAMKNVRQSGDGLPAAPRLEPFEPQYPSPNSFAADAHELEERLHRYSRSADADFVQVPIEVAIQHMAEKLQRSRGEERDDNGRGKEDRDDRNARPARSRSFRVSGDANSGRVFREEPR